MKFICNNIDACLKEKKIPKMRFYEDCDISSAAYSLWKTGKTKPTMKNLETIASYLDTTVSDLLIETGREAKKDPAPIKESEVIPNYSELNDENRALINSMIDKLLKSQSEQ